MKLSASDLSAAGARIVGILVIIKSIQILIMTVPSVFGLYSPKYPGWMLGQQIIVLIYPLALLLICIYLLHGTNRMVNKFYPGEDKNTIESASSLLQLAMKITGMVLIVYAIPQLLRIVSYAFYMHYYARYGINMPDPLLHIAENSLASFVSLLFGFYLLYGGRFFLRLALKNKENDNHDFFL